MSVLKIVLVVMAVLCGVVLVANIATGSFTHEQVAGVGIVLAALATVTP